MERYYELGMISARAFNICKAADIGTLGDLILYHHEGSLRKLRNCGPYTIKEFESVMGLVNYKHAVQLLEKLDRYEDLPESIKSIIVTHYKRTLLDFSLDCIRRFYDTFSDCKSFYSFFFCDLKDLDVRFNSLGSWEMKHYCYQLLSEIHSSLWKEQLDDTYTYELIVITRAILWFCDDDFAAELEAKDWDLMVRRKALLDDFHEKASQLINAAASVRRYLIPDYLRAVSMMQLSEGEVRSKLLEIRTWGHTYRTIFLFLAELKETLYRYESIDGDELGHTVVANKYRYLKEEQVGFVADFYKQYGYYPMFFLLRERLATTKERVERIFAMATGLFDGCPKNLAEIGKEMECTRERVRQLMVLAPKELFKDKGWTHYQLNNTLVVSEVDDLFLNVVENEKVNISFETFALVCTEAFPMKLVKVNDLRFLIYNQLNVHVINKVSSEVGKQNRRVRSEISTIKLDDLLKEVPDHKKGIYKEALPVIIAKAYGLPVDETGNIVLPPNGVDIVYELSEILREKGRPMSLRELYASLIKRCPEVKHKSFEHVRGKVLRSDALIPIGKSSRYTLVEWNNVYRGSIRELVADILKEAKTPLHIDVIMEKVLQEYPHTTKKNVVTSINKDEARFVLYGNGVYGLAGRKYGRKFVALKTEHRGFL
ncbi:MAG: hypothetical protein IJQ83_05885 [Bacteroidales bacterium]|nr:hypothetical protein [Bacteroidales bacterium]